MMRENEGGFTLIEVVVGAVLMVMMVTAVGGLFVSNLQSVALGKSTAIGLGIANNQMELLRDLPYASLATAHGTIYPPGNLADSQTIVQDNFSFTVKIQIDYVDDPYDGNAQGTIVGKPKDIYPYDYKEAEVDVYLNPTGQKVAELASNFSAKAAETATNSGVLNITVINASGQPVPNATVTVTNATPSPAVNITTTTDNNGVVEIPLLPPESNNSYKVTATLGGYSTDQTISPPGGGQTAVEPNPNILAQQVTSITMTIDQLSTLYINAVNTSGAAISNLAITTTGAKLTKKNPNVYKYSASNTTNATGQITLNGMEWDSYSFAVPAGNYIVSTQPYSPAPLSPNSSATVTLVISNSATWPVIASVTPISEKTGQAAASISVTGSNLPATSTMAIAMTGQTNIVATGCTSSGSNPTMVLKCNLNLTGAATGTWNMILTNSTGSTTQTGGFSVIP
jgi:type II secretory pathway pseudopilin PulG